MRMADDKGSEEQNHERRNAMNYMNETTVSHGTGMVEMVTNELWPMQIWKDGEVFFCYYRDEPFQVRFNEVVGIYEKV